MDTTKLQALTKRLFYIQVIQRKEPPRNIPPASLSLAVHIFLGQLYEYLVHMCSIMFSGEVINLFPVRLWKCSVHLRLCWVAMESFGRSGSLQVML